MAIIQSLRIYLSLLSEDYDDDNDCIDDFVKRNAESAILTFLIFLFFHVHIGCVPCDQKKIAKCL